MGQSPCFPTGARAPALIASTRSSYNCSIAETALRENQPQSCDGADRKSVPRDVSSSPASNNFRSVEWAPDGSNLLTSSADHAIRTFSSSPEDPAALELSSKTLLPSPSTSSTFLPSPDPLLVLSSPRSLPLRLTSPLSPSPSKILASYPLVHPSTEAFLSAHSMLSSPWDPNRMFLGMERGMGVGVLDLSRDGQGPQACLALGTGVAGKGGKGEMVSALACEPASGWLVAGTWGRWVGVYDGRGRGAAVSLFNLKHSEEAKGVGCGQGVAKVGFVGNGNYLLVRERSSQGIGVWDVRRTGRRLAWLETGGGTGMMKVGFEVWGDELWAGLGNGWVGVWEGVGMKEGIRAADWGWRAHDGRSDVASWFGVKDRLWRPSDNAESDRLTSGPDAVAAVSIHPWGTAIATCSGQRLPADKDERGRHVVDNSVKVWSLGSDGVGPMVQESDLGSPHSSSHSSSHTLASISPGGQEMASISETQE